MHRTTSSTTSTSIPETVTSASTDSSSSILNFIQPPNHSLNLVNQLVIRARLQPTHDGPTHSTLLASSQGLQLVISIKLSIPYSIIPLPGSPDLTLPLMPDRNLRLCHSTVFPLSRRSSKSRPIIQASNQQAHLAASILNLSKSFRLQNDKLPKPPPITVVVRNFTISLVISPSFLPSLNTFSGLDCRSPMAEYAIVLNCLSPWATMGPDWPFSIILPTPPCLKNSFRLLLPTDSIDDLSPDDMKDRQPSTLCLSTFPPLRRERSRFSMIANPIHSAQSAVFSDDDMRPLSDESEPEGISFLPDEDDEPIHNPCSNWAQDDLSPRIEGVFPSTKELCIILGSDPQIANSTLDNPITANRASSRLSVSVQPPPNNLDPTSAISIDLNFHVDLEHIGTQSTNHKTPLILAIPQLVANQIISARWSPLNAEGIIQTALPSALPGNEVTPPNSLAAIDQPSPSSSPSSFELTFASNPDSAATELDLLNTAAPFEELESEARAEIIPDEPVLDFASNEPPRLEDKLASKMPYQFVVWFDTEWLIRSAATTHNQRLVLNLHGQLDLAIPLSPDCDTPHHPFPIPCIILPSVDQHTCTCEISMAPTDSLSRQVLQFNLPSWARLLESSSDQHSHHLELCLNKTHTQTMENLIMAQLDSPPADDTIVMSPERLLAQPPTPMKPSESNLSIGTLIISPAGRIRHHSRRSTTSNLGLARKRPRHTVPLKNKASKIIAKDNVKDSSPIEPPLKLPASIRSVQLDLLIASPFSSCSPLTQFGELSITFSRPMDITIDPWVSATFQIECEDTVEVLGAWIGDRELTRPDDLEYSEVLESENPTEARARSVIIKLNLPDICSSSKLETSNLLPMLRIVYKAQKRVDQDSQKKESQTFWCSVPSLGSPVGTYKISLQTCAGFEVQIDRSNMLISESSPNGAKLVQYSVPLHTINQTHATIKPASSLPECASLERSSPTCQPVEQGTTCENQPSNLKTKDEDDWIARLSWTEICSLQWGISFKTILLCWLIYLVSYVSVQLNAIGDRLDVIELRQSQHPAAQSVHVQFPTQARFSNPVPEDGPRADFGRTVEPFLAQMVANGLKPSFVYNDLAKSPGGVVLPDQVDQPTSESMPPTPPQTELPPLPRHPLPPPISALEKPSFFAFLARLWTRSGLQPLASLLKKLAWAPPPSPPQPHIVPNHDEP